MNFSCKIKSSNNCHKQLIPNFSSKALILIPIRYQI